jgi:hypothetical protein
MICAKCGKEHDNVRGQCPHCRTSAKLVKRQKEKPYDSEVSGPFSFYVGPCHKCGREVPGTVMRLAGATARLLGAAEWFTPDPHNCTRG